MRAVNLLPESDRVRNAPSAPAGSSRILVGVLAVFVLAMLAVVLTQNQITDRKQEVSKLTTERQAAEVKAGTLGSFGQFAQIKETRVKSIGDLAKQRFDYERLMRELALVLPDGTWVSALKASSSGSPEVTASSAPTTTDSSSTPSAEISGCAKSQSRVAETMVRLRSLYRADDVTLSDSTGPNQDDSSSSAGNSGGQTEGASAQQGCGNNYAFTATVQFTGDDGREVPSHRKSVPGRLGGGS